MRYEIRYERRCETRRKLRHELHGGLAALAALAIAGVTGCGVEQPVDGPGLNSADASASGADGSVVDGVGTGGGVCGDGLCDPVENPSNCPLDCKGAPSSGGSSSGASSSGASSSGASSSGASSSGASSSGASSSGASSSGGDPCGDGTCQPRENAELCPQDCSTDPPDPICGDGICAKWESPQSCPDDCGKPGPWCGNGACEKGESSDTCAKDCGGKVVPTLACVQKNCPKPLQGCVSVPTCAELVKCLSGCGDMEACFAACIQAASSNPATMKAFEPLAQCSQDKGCAAGPAPSKCGNGNCEQGESYKSCPLDCKPPPGPVCGNGQCEPGESPGSCQKDCGGGGPGQVLHCVKGKCGGAWKSCSAAAGCAKVLDCMTSCGDNGECIGGCIEKYQQVAFPQILPLLQCAQNSGCVDGGGGGGGSKCGDGQCTPPSESPASCPQDCKGPPGLVCGDGKCVGPEPVTCPQDCKQSPKPACGDGKCDFGEWKSCPKDCKQPPKPVCGDGKCDKPYENAKSCPKDCQNTPPQPATCVGRCDQYTKGASCQCDKSCAMFNDCCGDYDLVCGGPLPDTCGDGKCDPARENAGNCPKDCDKQPPPIFVCGNGKCEEPFENAKSCPADCKDQPPGFVCGNGICEPPYETALSCKADCAAAQPKKCKSTKDCGSGEVCCKKGGQLLCLAPGACGG